MIFSLRPSDLQMRLESQKTIEPCVKELCALYIEEKNLKITAEKIKKLESEVATLSATESITRLIDLTKQDRQSREICNKFRAKIFYYLHNRQSNIIRKLAHALYPTSLEEQKNCRQQILQRSPTAPTTKLLPIAETVSIPNEETQDKTSEIPLSSSPEQINFSPQKRAFPEKFAKFLPETCKKSRVL
jgi:plasmid stabilization system protein ParE